MSENTNTLDDGISAEFWAVPEAFIKDESLRFLHADVCTRLRQENPGADTLELMAIERIASLFFYMRDRENAGAIKNDSAYKSMLSLWTTMAADLRKTRMGALEESTIRTQIMTEVVDAVKSATAGFEPEVKMLVRRKLSESLRAA